MVAQSQSQITTHLLLPGKVFLSHWDTMSQAQPRQTAASQLRDSSKKGKKSLPQQLEGKRGESPTHPTQIPPDAASPKLDSRVVLRLDSPCTRSWALMQVQQIHHTSLSHLFPVFPCLHTPGLKHKGQPPYLQKPSGLCSQPCNRSEPCTGPEDEQCHSPLQQGTHLPPKKITHIFLS